MIILYHCVSARSFRPLWMLEELGLSYQLRMLPFPPRELDVEYLSVNPLGTVPTLIDGETRLTESAAICQYLAARAMPSPLAVRPDELEYGTYLNYLHFGEATLTFPQTIVLRYGYLEPPSRRHPQIVDDYAKWFISRLRTLEPVLKEYEWLVADRFTAADVCVGYALVLADHLGLSERFRPGAQAYFLRLRSRAGFQRALAAQQVAAREQNVSTEPAPDIRPYDRDGI